MGIDVTLPRMADAEPHAPDHGEQRRQPRRIPQADHRHAALTYSPYDAPFTVDFNLASTELELPGDPDSRHRFAARSTDQMQISATYTPAANLSLSGHYGINELDHARHERPLRRRGHPALRALDAEERSEPERGSHALGVPTAQSRGHLQHAADRQSRRRWGRRRNDGDDDEVEQIPRYEDANTSAWTSRGAPRNLNLTLAGGIRDYSSGGGLGYLADSEQTYYNASFGWQSPAVALTATWGRDEQVFLEEGAGAVKNNMIALGANYRPREQPWGVAQPAQAERLQPDHDQLRQPADHAHRADRSL
jgi:hypothetical protein